MEHTPLPWKVFDRSLQTFPWFIIGNNHRGMICEMHNIPYPYNEQKTDAEFIVRAVNNFDDLLWALKKASEILKDYHSEYGDCDHQVNHCVCDIVQMREMVDGTIAKAEGK